jgi:putative FmdB family regulatory protein
MPTYGFICNKCKNEFEELLSIDNREKPLEEKCPSCKKKGGVSRNYNSYTQTIGSDTNLTANSATGGRWNELMGRMKTGISKRYHKNLDIASKQTGRHWSG